ncbi:MAG: hypothetical protein AAFX01_04795 [Cyanobacteria bacterium J06638_28]
MDLPNDYPGYRDDLSCCFVGIAQPLGYLKQTQRGHRHSETELMLIFPAKLLHYSITFLRGLVALFCQPGLPDRGGRHGR